MKRDIFIIGAVLLGVYAFTNVTASIANKIGWFFRGIDIDSVGISDGLSVNFGIKLEIDNKTRLSIPIERFEGKVLYKGQDLTPVQNRQYAVIEANKRTLLKFIVPVKRETLKQIYGGGSFAEVLRNVKDSLLPRHYYLTGTVYFRIANTLYKHEINEPFSIS